LTIWGRDSTNGEGEFVCFWRGGGGGKESGDREYPILVGKEQKGRRPK